MKIAKKLQVVLDYVRKGVAYAQPGKGGVQEVMPLYEVSTCNDVGLHTCRSFVPSHSMTFISN